MVMLKCHWNRKSHIYGDLKKRKLSIDMIKILLLYYHLGRCYLTANYCLGSYGQSRKQNKQIYSLWDKLICGYINVNNVNFPQIHINKSLQNVLFLSICINKSMY